MVVINHPYIHINFIKIINKTDTIISSNILILSLLKSFLEVSKIKIIVYPIQNFILYNSNEFRLASMSIELYIPNSNKRSMINLLKYLWRIFITSNYYELKK